jgi:hypothetical protein
MAGRKPNVFSKTILQSWSLSTIIERAVEYDAKVKNKTVATRDTLRADSLIKTLISISEESFKSKSSISNKLIDALLSRDEQVTKAVSEQLLSLGGYKYSDINNMIYYLTWFACTSEEPIYATLDEFAKSLND